MAVYGYVRVSTLDQATDGSSLDAQQRQLEGYAMMKGWALAGTFVEKGVSGSTALLDRPEGGRLLAVVGKGDIIVTAKLDRMFRNAADALATLEEMKAGGVALHMLDLGGDVCGNGISKLVFTILSAVAENERDRIRERIRDVKRHLRDKGAYAGGKVPFGYDNVDGKLVENPAEQVVIRRMVKMRAEGSTYRDIAEAVKSRPGTVQRIIDREISRQGG